MAISEDIILNDSVSSPAKSAADAVSDLGSAFSAVTSLASALSEGAGQMGDGLGKALEGKPEGIEEIVEGLATMAEALADVTAKALETGAALALSDTTFREDSVAVLSKLSKDGDAMYDKATKIASKLGETKEEVVDQVKKLLGAGIGENQIDKIETALADFAAVRGKSGSARLENTIEKINATGSLDQRAFKQLEQMGISAADVYTALEKATGKSLDGVKAALKTGKIDAKEGIDAVLAVVEGKAGGIAEKMADSVPGLLTKIKDSFSGLFDHVDLGPIKKELHDVLDALNGPAGKHLAESFTHLFDAIFGGFSKLGGKQGAAGVIDGIASGIDRVAAAAKVVVPLLVDGLVLVVGAIKTVGEAVAWMADHWQAIAIVTAPIWVPLAAGAAVVAIGVAALGVVVYGLVSTFESVVETVQDALDALGGFSGIGDAVSGVFSKIGGAVSAAVDWVKAKIDSVVSIGRSFVEGIAHGITGGLSSVIAAVVNVARSAVNAAKSALGIASPSRVAGEEIGEPFSEGAAGGVDRAAPSAAAAAARMAKGTVDAAKAAHARAANDNALRFGAERAASAAHGHASNATAERAAARAQGGQSPQGREGESGRIATPSSKGATVTNHHTVTFSPGSITAAVHIPPGTPPDQAHEIGKKAGDAAGQEMRKHLTQFLREMKEAG